MRTAWPLAAMLAVLASSARAQELDEVRLKDGRVLHGRVISEAAASFVLCLPDGAIATIDRAQLYALMRSATSADAGLEACVASAPTPVVPPPEIVERPPPGQHAELVRAYPGLGAAGTVTLLASYLLLAGYTLLAASSFGGHGDAGPIGSWLYVPIVGPLVFDGLAVGQVDWNTLSLAAWVAIAVVVRDQLAQLGGAAMLAVHLFHSKERAWVPDEAAAADEPAKVRWSLVPGAGRSPLGVTLAVARW